MTTGNGTHPITTLIDQAAENIRLANHASYGATRDVTDLYATFGALAQLLNRVPQLIGHLQLIVRDTDVDAYLDASDESDADYRLHLTEACLIEVTTNVTEATDLINAAWSHIGQLRPRDIDSPGDTE